MLLGRYFVFYLGFCFLGCTFAELPATIEDAIRQNGGTYGVIDTTTPDTATNFVDIVFDNGLTNSDAKTSGSTSCSNILLLPGVTIRCVFDKAVESWYSYDGKKGEKIVLTVTGNGFVPSVAFYDADGLMDFFENKENTKTVVIKKELYYNGEISIRINAPEWGTSYIGKDFSIRVTADTSSLVPESEDSLVAGNTYTVAQLQKNYTTTSREFFTEAYVVDTYVAPPCAPNGYCEKSEPPYITISDVSLYDFQNLKDGRVGPGNMVHARLYLDDKAQVKSFEIDKKYRFKVSVINRSQTNTLGNMFSLVSFTEIQSSGPTEEHHGGLLKSFTVWVKSLFFSNIRLF